MRTSSKKIKSMLIRMSKLCQPESPVEKAFESFVKKTSKLMAVQAQKSSKEKL